MRKIKLVSEKLSFIGEVQSRIRINNKIYKLAIGFSTKRASKSYQKQISKKYYSVTRKFKKGYGVYIKPK